MPEPLFDRASEYEAMLNQGIGLSGESQQFFIEGRIKDLQSRLPSAPHRILDFGCGTGQTCEYLSRAFPGAHIVGADLSANAVVHAQKLYSATRVQFVQLDSLNHFEPFDLCYINGVFHHVPPPERQSTLRTINSYLVPGSHLAIFENNPWNPGTRLVMRRIPFDRDAILLSFLEMRNLMRTVGCQVQDCRFLFYLPRPLAAFRFIEPWLATVPLGAQYYILARTPVFQR